MLQVQKVWNASKTLHFDNIDTLLAPSWATDMKRMTHILSLSIFGRFLCTLRR